MVGDNIRRIREERGMRQEDLAEKVGVSIGAVSSWETGRTLPRMGALEKICVALNCKKSDIIGRDTAMELTEHERALVIAYRMNPDMQLSVDRLLGIEKRERYSTSLTDRKEA